ncbi:hypothetical protein PMI01_00714 [Caulobacter sp. AP07]|uniref:hypothetical protein n=1 Tax=Caulobacter sp. AP07 TaxID=1144304 RepID=UPI000271FC00|nr:hypothetical protein [Caulobacter sp. AP07]EJL37358.1 hypothetical protein PMI01_00714 [Caulobacter sp. AP07]
MAALDLARIKPVLFPLDPIPGETIRGYAGRVAQHNVYGNPSDLLLPAGLSLNDLRRGRADPRVLAKIYGVGVDQLDPMVPKGLASREHWTTVYGLDGAPYSFRQTPCPISPSGLRRSPHHRFSWSLRRLSFCAEDWSLLVGHCLRCRAQLRWHSGPIHECSSCHLDLRDGTVSYIQSPDRPYLSVAANLVSFELQVRQSALEQLPNYLRPLAPEDVLSVAVAIGQSLRCAGHPLGKVSSAAPTYPATMLTGMRFILDGAAGGAEGTMRGVSSDVIVKARKNLSWRAREAAEPVFHALQEARRTTRLFGRASTLSITAAAASARLGRSTMRRLIRHGLVLAYPSGGGDERRHDDVDVASLAEIKSLIRSRISIRQLSRGFKLPSGVVEKILADKEIEPLDGESIRLIYKEPQYHNKQVMDLFKEIERSVERISQRGECRVLLSEVFGKEAHLDAMWAAVLVAEDVPDGIGSNAPYGLDPLHLHVSLRGAAMLEAGGLPAFPAELESAPMTLKDAEVRLKSNPRDIQRLIKVGLLIRRGKGLCRRSVTSCGRMLMSSRELAESVGVDPMDVSALANVRSLKRPYWGIGFWMRDEADALLPQHLTESRSISGPLASRVASRSEKQFASNLRTGTGNDRWTCSKVTLHSPDHQA